MWKNIKGYEGHYLINDNGEVFSIKRNKVMNNQICGRDRNYYQVWLCKNGKGKRYLVHRLVAEAFLDNPNNYSVINHKDENGFNNCVNNLEWCTPSYNRCYGTCSERIKEKTGKKVYLFSLEGELISVFKSTRDAAKAINGDNSTISKVCRGVKLTHKGYRWSYNKSVC